LLESLVRSTHPPLQAVSPVVHVVEQTPLEHTLGDVQGLPHPPQFAALVSGSTHVVPHTISPAAQPLVSAVPVSSIVSTRAMSAATESVEAVSSPDASVPIVVSSVVVSAVAVSSPPESAIVVSVPPPVLSSRVAVSGASPVPPVSSLPHPTVKPTAMNSHAAELRIGRSP